MATENRRNRGTEVCSRKLFFPGEETEKWGKTLTYQACLLPSLLQLLDEVL